MSTDKGGRVNGLLTASQMADKLGIPQSTFSDYVRKGRVPGAVKVSSIWLVPDNLTEDDIDKPQMGRPPKNEKANGNGR